MPQVFELFKLYRISRFIGVGPDVSKYMHALLPNATYYNSTQDLLFDSNLQFENEVILLKGARTFRFEQIAKSLEFQTHKTVLEINLQAIISNLNYFRSLLKPETKLIVMVKAFSYGSGSYEIANVLQHHRVDYLAVAFVDEGIELRNAGITLPIIVMNPEIGVMPQLFEYDLEPEIHSFSVLQEYKEICIANSNKECKMHVKIDTGMVRYGFSEFEIPELISELTNIPNAKVVSVFSHLVGSDSLEFDTFTQNQIEQFDSISSQILHAFNYKIERHILNSAGIERFSEYQFDAVRLGIGLYGISSKSNTNTSHISTLKTFVSSIHTIKKDQSVGYSRKGRVTRDSIIAVLPIGYADGLNRRLSRGVGTVIINGVEVPIVGNICMDATMIDVTDVSVKVGDEVILFGEELPITVMAQKLETIPYEIITSISRRVKRIYVYE